ncbi:S9 family peptidase [Nesterenkonia sandarakina]|uniref:Oligopeptidase B n=1 Tax=Nesterenkonia sandarakina TaxID=272918 RepID=A0A7Z0E7W7_9MICC|nr:S9 family peptidase [Nesterenkonia sandarakina]NYJ15977.1 oligopeptidase B [Nesterenkonia sandarakina]
MSDSTAPQAKQVPTERTHHGDTFVDHYEWLREKDSPEVLEHLHAENAYAEAVTAAQKPLRERIFEEIKHRTVETDLSVPSRRGDWWYFTRTIEGEQHPVYCRVAAGPAADVSPQETGAGQNDGEHGSWTPPEVEAGVALEGEQTFFDTNAEAAQHPFYQLGGLSLNAEGTLLAYSEDTSGDEHYTVRFRDLGTGENHPEQIGNVHGGPVLDPTGRRAYYMVADAAWRPYRLYMHTLGTPAEQDRLVLEISDEQLWTGVGLSADKRELVIISGNSEYDESRLLDVTDPDAEPVLLIGAERRLLHSIDPIEVDGERLLLITHNQSGPNNALSVTTAEALTAQAAGVGSDPDQPLDLGRPVLPHEETVKLEGVTVTAAQVIVTARRNTVESVQLLSVDALRAARTGADPVRTSTLPGPAFEEELYTCAVIAAEYEAPLFRVAYESWLTPTRIYDIDHRTAEPVLRRETPVHDVDLEAYRATRIWAPTGDTRADGSAIEVPVTVLHHRDVVADGTNPTLVYGYGSYEMSMDPSFGIPRLSLLDRGIVFAIAHIRGGGELGRGWYEDGKKLKKMNTFTDFIAATDHLIDQGWADPARVAALGGSAGGLLMGAVANMAPEKYVAILAQVPFVDNLTTILDPELPLSALEWEEWGNPITDPEVYRYMKSYAPYENVRELAYPAIAAVTSLNDTRVLYVEPAKWVQVLREHQRGESPVVLKIEMDGGHGGASGRYETWKERAWDYAFIAHHLGADQKLGAGQDLSGSEPRR